MIADEAKLKTALKLSSHNLYFFYGKEAFLVKTYTDRVIKQYLSQEDMDFNLIKLGGDGFNVSDFVEGIESLPVFAEHKVVVVRDCDYEKLDAESHKQLCSALENVPSSTIVVFSNVNVLPDTKKAKTKKILAAADKNGIVTEFDYLTVGKIVDMVGKKCAKQGVYINDDAARHLCELALRDLTLISTETEKLCGYVGQGGTVTREIVDLLVARQLDTGIYDLTNALAKRDGVRVFTILSELEQEGHPAVVIMGALSGTFVDYYRAGVGSRAGKGQAEIAERFSYAKNRAWVIGKSITAAKQFTPQQLQDCLELLAQADLKLKSTSIDQSVILQQTLVQIMQIM